MGAGVKIACNAELAREPYLVGRRYICKPSTLLTRGGQVAAVDVEQVQGQVHVGVHQQQACKTRCIELVGWLSGASI